MHTQLKKPNDHIVFLFTNKGNKKRIDPWKVRWRDNVCNRGVAMEFEQKSSAPPGGNSYYRASLPDSRSSEFYGDCRVFGWTRLTFYWISGPPGKLQNFTNDYHLLKIATIIWLKYCRYCVKPLYHQSINLCYFLLIDWLIGWSFTPKRQYISNVTRLLFFYS